MSDHVLKLLDAATLLVGGAVILRLFILPAVVAVFRRVALGEEIKIANEGLSGDWR